MNPSSSSLILISLAASSLSVACARTPSPPELPVDELVRNSRDGNAALMRGDVERYQSLIAIADDFTLFSPFGGEPTRGIDRERMERMRRFFRNGTFEQELVHAYGTRDMIVLAIVERARVEVGDVPMQDWALRVTLVYRRDGDQWRLVHRHADPLAHGISQEHAAALGRGGS